MSLYERTITALYMSKAKRHAEAIKALDVLHLAIEPWATVIKELRADRGILLGSAQYEELNGVERCEALEKVDSTIMTAQKFIEEYEHIFKMKLKELRIRRGSVVIE